CVQHIAFCCFRIYFVWMGLLGFCRKRDWLYSRHIRNFRNMSRMRVKGDWEDVVEFYSMGLGKFLRRIGGGMWKGNVLVFGIVGRRWGKGIFENLREVEPGFVG